MTLAQRTQIAVRQMFDKQLGNHAVLLADEIQKLNTGDPERNELEEALRIVLREMDRRS